MNLAKQRDDLIAEAKGLAAAAKSAGRDLNKDELDRIDAINEKVEELNVLIKRQNNASSILESFTEREVKAASETVEERRAKSLGEHVVKNMDLVKAKSLLSTRGAVVQVDKEFAAKAAGDTHVVPTSPSQLILPDIDKNLVRPFQPRLFIADWLGAGTIDSNAITYFVESVSSAMEGDFATVAENGKFPDLHFGGYDQVTETLRKVGGLIHISNEMLEDAPFVASEINGRLLQRLAQFEEKMLLSGDGSGTNIKGLLNRQGLLTETASTAADVSETIYNALTKVETATGFSPDAIVIHPNDYSKLRLEKDKNGQYFAGGPFGPAYGNGEGVRMEPPIWGVPVIKTAAIAEKTILVGSSAAATIYRKGGIAVDFANQHDEDFAYDRVAIRAKERLALAVRYPSAFCKITVES